MTARAARATSSAATRPTLPWPDMPMMQSNLSGSAYPSSEVSMTEFGETSVQGSPDALRYASDSPCWTWSSSPSCLTAPKSFRMWAPPAAWTAFSTAISRSAMRASIGAVRKTCVTPATATASVSGTSMSATTTSRFGASRLNLPRSRTLARTLTRSSPSSAAISAWPNMPLPAVARTARCSGSLPVRPRRRRGLTGREPMQREVLVTAGNGMFGHALIAALLGDERVKVRAMVRDRGKFKREAPNLDVVVADMDVPETLAVAVAGVTHVFLTAPMDARIAEREIAVLKAVQAAGGAHILKLFGAVRHEGDELHVQHGESLAYLKASGLPWTLVSPNSVMETSLLGYAEPLKFDCIMGMSGHGKVGLVAAEDVALAVARHAHDAVELERLGVPQQRSLHDG